MSAAFPRLNFRLLQGFWLRRGCEQVNSLRIAFGCGQCNSVRIVIGCAQVKVPYRQPTKHPRPHLTPPTWPGWPDPSDQPDRPDHVRGGDGGGNSFQLLEIEAARPGWKFCEHNRKPFKTAQAGSITEQRVEPSCMHLWLCSRLLLNAKPSFSAGFCSRVFSLAAKDEPCQTSISCGSCNDNKPRN